MTQGQLNSLRIDERLAEWLGPLMDRFLGQKKLIIGGLAVLTVMALQTFEVIPPSSAQTWGRIAEAVFGVGIVHLGVNRQRERTREKLKAQEAQSNAASGN